MVKIITAVRCMNEIEHISRFMDGYDFSDVIVVSDGGSTDGSVEELQKYPKVILHHYDKFIERDGVRFKEVLKVIQVNGRKIKKNLFVRKKVLR